jgi:hypothetical protein
MRLILLCLLLAGCGDGGGLMEPAEKPNHAQQLAPEK